MLYTNAWIDDTLKYHETLSQSGGKKKLINVKRLFSKQFFVNFTKTAPFIFPVSLRKKNSKNICKKKKKCLSFVCVL